MSEIDDAGNLEQYKNDLKKDIDALDNLSMNLERFQNKIEKETVKPNTVQSADDKLQMLLEKIQKKQGAKANGNNRKLVIFTAYKDTATYLFTQLKERGFSRLAMVTGTGSMSDDDSTETKKFEPILERFAPFTKLFKEKEWPFKSDNDLSDEKQRYDEWISWLAETNDPAHQKILNPIDILIATDALSEGQNLQDADTVVNYDIHWNHVRIIQRMGRIDRIGSPNKSIMGINFWPSGNINSYLNLQDRIEQRMTAMKLAGSEVNLEFSETFAQMASDADLENKMKARMIQQMQTSWDDIEINDQGLGFDDLSLEKFRQDLLSEFKSNEQKYKQMPKGVYTGFRADQSICPEQGLIALLGYPSRPPQIKEHSYQTYDLIYIDMYGKPVLLNQKEVLDALAAHQDRDRYVHKGVDNGDEKKIQSLVNAIKNWLSDQAVEEEKQEDGTLKKRMGAEAKDVLAKLKSGDANAIKTVKKNITVGDKYRTENFDLITWFVISQKKE